MDVWPHGRPRGGRHWVWKSLACLELQRCQPGRPFSSAEVAGSLFSPMAPRDAGSGSASSIWFQGCGAGRRRPGLLLPAVTCQKVRDQAESPVPITRVTRVRVLSSKKSSVHGVCSKQFPDAPLKSGSPKWAVEGRKERGWGEANRPPKTGPKTSICFAEGAYGKNTARYRRKSLFSEEFYIQPTNYAVD